MRSSVTRGDWRRFGRGRYKRGTRLIWWTWDRKSSWSVSYRYVLSVIDVFSRFVWLRPVSKKSSRNIADALQSIYLEHGPPHVIQCDQGGEFKGAVIEICRKLQIKVIRSSPYHPQSQGKVERSHRALRSKIAYEFVQNLPDYQSILNEDPKEVLGYKTVYFARRPYSCNTAMADEEVVQNVGYCDPSEGDRRRHSKRASKIRRQASKASKRCSERMVRGHTRSHPPSKYNVGEKVYVRLPRKGGIKDVQKKRYVIEAVVVKRNVNYQAYKVAYHSPITGHNEEKWLPVNDITSLTLGEEKRKQQVARLPKKRKRAHHNKYYVPMKPDDYNKIIEDQGFQIEFDPPGDGSHQFAALAHQLSAFRIFRTPEEMHEEIVRYLENNAVDEKEYLLANRIFMASLRVLIGVKLMFMASLWGVALSRGLRMEARGGTRYKSGDHLVMSLFCRKSLSVLVRSIVLSPCTCTSSILSYWFHFIGFALVSNFLGLWPVIACRRVFLVPSLFLPSPF